MADQTFYLFGNWKMYLTHDESVAVARELKTWSATLPERLRLAVFPSALSFTAVVSELAGSPVATGAQNVHWVGKGGYTGEISAEMYALAGARYALIGHSERRHLCGETNHQVRQKLEAALAAGLTPVLCVGETREERESDQAGEVVEAQLRAAYEELAWPEAVPLIIAYEPVWAIGTGEACDPGEAARMHGMIHSFLGGLLPSVEPILIYGGSVREENAAQYLGQENIQGVLVGGASVKLPSWQAIVNQAANS